jgi:hypothetical protein
VKPPPELALAYEDLARQRTNLLMSDPPRRRGYNRIGAAIGGYSHEPFQYVARREIAVDIKRGVDVGDVDPQVAQPVERYAQSPATSAWVEPDSHKHIARRATDEFCCGVRPGDGGANALLPHDIGAPVGHHTQLVCGLRHANP